MAEPGMISYMAMATMSLSSIHACSQIVAAKRELKRAEVNVKRAQR